MGQPGPDTPQPQCVSVAQNISLTGGEQQRGHVRGQAPAPGQHQVAHQRGRVAHVAARHALEVRRNLTPHGRSRDGRACAHAGIGTLCSQRPSARTASTRPRQQASHRQRCRPPRPAVGPAPPPGTRPRQCAGRARRRQRSCPAGAALAPATQHICAATHKRRCCARCFRDPVLCTPLRSLLLFRSPVGLATLCCPASPWCTSACAPCLLLPLVSPPPLPSPPQLAPVPPPASADALPFSRPSLPFYFLSLSAPGGGAPQLCSSAARSLQSGDAKAWAGA